jgi:hypothetical protein
MLTYHEVVTNPTENKNLHIHPEIYFFQLNKRLQGLKCLNHTDLFNPVGHRTLKGRPLNLRHSSLKLR